MGVSKISCYLDAARMATADERTATEDSLADNSTLRLFLEWVWPTRKREHLQGARLEIGRDSSSKISLPGNGVSRIHAELYRQGPLYVLRDLGSTNGTWLGGKRIEHAPVGPGAVLRVGEWVGVFSERSEDDGQFGELTADVFGGPELAAAIEPLRRGAAASLPVVLIGATGTGKERIARATHAFGGRTGPFVAVNCAAIPEHLAEAELFGYRRGAFTGAERASLGLFRSAHGGTLFLDEMPELSLTLQAKLLRVLEDGQVLGLGESTPASVDVRIVSASQSPLRRLAEQGKLRQDLAARLSGIEVKLPLLRERRADIAPLFRQFLQRHSGGLAPAVESRVVEALCLHDWSDNVRELELLTRRLLAIHGHEGTLRRQHLPPELAALNQDTEKRERVTTIPQERRDHDLGRLKVELERNGGNVKAAGAGARDFPTAHLSLDGELAARERGEIPGAAVSHALRDPGELPDPEATEAMGRRLRGTVVAGTYRLGHCIGAGATSLVLEAEHVRLGRLFAVKLLRAELEGRRAAQRFRREARAIARLQSEHVVSVVD